MKKTILVLLLTISVACAPKYGKAGWRGGYSETPLQGDTYRVAYVGGSEKFVEKGLHLRCAEIAKEKGFEWFSVIQSSTKNDPVVFSSPGYTIITPTGQNTDGGNTEFGSSENYQRHEVSEIRAEIDEYKATAVIRLLNTKPSDGEVFHAETVYQELKSLMK